MKIFVQGKQRSARLLSKLGYKGSAYQFIAAAMIAISIGVSPAKAAQIPAAKFTGDRTDQTLHVEEQPTGAEGIYKSERWPLERLVSEAVAHHPETAAQRASLEGAKATASAALWQFFPAPFIDVQQSDNGAASIGVKQPIWTGGKLTSNLNAAKSRVASADISIAETQNSVALRVVSAYQSLLQFNGRIAAEREYILSLEGFAEMMRRRVESAVSAKVDQSLVLARLSQARSEMISLQAGRRTALSSISELLGRPLEVTDVDYASSDISQPLPKLNGLVEQSEKLNPTLRRLHADIETAKYVVDQQESALWPDVSAKAQYDSNWRQSNGFFRKGESDGKGRLFVVFEFAPGAGLSSFSNIRAAKSKVDSLESSYEAARRDLRARVVSDYDDYINAFNRRQDLTNNVQASKEVLESYTRLFHAGKRSWLDVLNAAQELNQVEGAIADTQALYRASAYRLRIHAGTVPWLQEAGK